jgi:hypothetical protein
MPLGCSTFANREVRDIRSLDASNRFGDGHAPCPALS